MIASAIPDARQSYVSPADARRQQRTLGGRWTYGRWCFCAWRLARRRRGLPAGRCWGCAGEVTGLRLTGQDQIDGPLLTVQPRIARAGDLIVREVGAHARADIAAERVVALLDALGNAVGRARYPNARE